VISAPAGPFVTILADHGNRYQSKLFNPAFPAYEGLACADVAGTNLENDDTLCLMADDLDRLCATGRKLRGTQHHDGLRRRKGSEHVALGFF